VGYPGIITPSNQSSPRRVILDPVGGHLHLRSPRVPWIYLTSRAAMAFALIVSPWGRKPQSMVSAQKLSN
jgi:hypothetical protein